MRFYTNSHPFYCGIDLHARILYLCILDYDGHTIFHQSIKADPNALMQVLQPYQGNIIIGVECMHCWYWLSDWCEEHDIDFILGHALYMKAIHGGKAKNDKIDAFKIAKLIRGGNFPLAYTYPKDLRATRDLLRRRTQIVRLSAQMKAHIKNTNHQYNLPALSVNLKNVSAREKIRHRFPDPTVQKNIDLDLNLIDFYHREISSLEHYIKVHAKKHLDTEFNLLKTIPGVGDILALTMIYEIGDIRRFENVRKFASYSRLIKCQAESAGKIKGTRGNKIGNAYLKWAFSEAAALYLRDNPKGKQYIAKLEKRMPKGKALSALAHKIGRAAFFMLKQKTVFNNEKFLTA